MTIGDDEFIAAVQWQGRVIDVLWSLGLDLRDSIWLCEREP